MKISAYIVAVTALVAVEACSQPAGWVPKDLRTMARKADLVVGGQYINETVTKLRKIGSVTIIQKVVNSTFRVTSVYSRSPSAAANGACVPETITLSNVQVVSGCMDLRNYWRIDGKYVVALSYRNGAYTLYDSSQLCMWRLNADNVNIARRAQCGSDDDSSADDSSADDSSADDSSAVTTSPCPAANGGSASSAGTTAASSVTAATSGETKERLPN